MFYCRKALLAPDISTGVLGRGGGLLACIVGQLLRGPGFISCHSQKRFSLDAAVQKLFCESKLRIKE